MDSINENLTEKQTKDTVNPQICHKRRQRNLSFDINIKERIVITAQDIDNKQKLYDFISGGKNKLSLKTLFDHKGTKEFLRGKNEAMKKIELNESIEESNKIKSKEINRKRISKLKSNKSQKMLTKLDSINLNNVKKRKKNSLSTKNLGVLCKNKLLSINQQHMMTGIEDGIPDSMNHNKAKKRKKNSLSNKNLGVLYKNKLSSINQQHMMIGFEDEIPPPNWETHTPINYRKKNRKSLSKKKNKSRKKNVNVDKSINSIKTVDSKLFNDKKDYEHYKKNFLNKDDTSFIEGIINELDLNKEEALQLFGLKRYILLIIIIISEKEFIKLNELKARYIAFISVISL